MPIGEAIEIGSAVVAWAAAVIKVWDWGFNWANRSGRAMTTSQITLALAFTVQTKPVYHWLGAHSGLPDVARLLVHLLTLWSACAVLAMLANWGPGTDAERRSVEWRRWIAVSVASVILTALFLLDPTSREVVDIDNRYDDSNGWLVAYALVLYSYLGYSMASIMRGASRHAPNATRRRVRIGLVGLAWTGGIGVVFSVHQSLRVIAVSTGTAPSWWPHTIIGTLLQLLAVTVLLVMVVVLPASARILDTAQDAVRDRQATRDLEPLWRDLARRFPDLVFAPNATLYDRGIEITDGWRDLRPWLDADVRARAEAALDEQGVTDPAERASVVWATVLACGMDAAHVAWGPERTVELDASFDAEAVAKAYATNPTVARLRAEYAHEIGAIAPDDDEDLEHQL